MPGEDVQAMARCNAYAIVPAPDTLTRPRERLAGIHGLSIDTIELYERNMIDELALRLVLAGYQYSLTSGKPVGVSR